MLLIGLTGGIASGKSLVSRFLGELSIPIIDADKLAHEALLPGTPAYTWLQREHPDCIVNGLVDRGKVAQLVFNDKALRTHLESLVHPQVRRRMILLIIWYWLWGNDRVILDVPLLYETGLDKMMNLVIVVSCSQSTQIERLKRRNGMSEEEAVKRIEAQMPLSQKKVKSHLIIDNDSSLADLHDQVMRVARLTKPDPLVHVLGYWLVPLFSGVIAIYILIRAIY